MLIIPNFIKKEKYSLFKIPEDKFILDNKENVETAIKLFDLVSENEKFIVAKRIKNAAKKFNIDIPSDTQCYRYIPHNLEFDPFISGQRIFVLDIPEIMKYTLKKWI